MFSGGANWFELSLFPHILKGINACWVLGNNQRRSHQVHGMHCDPRTVLCVKWNILHGGGIWE